MSKVATESTSYYTKEPFEYHDAITSIWFDNAPIGAVGSNGDYNSPCDLNSGGGGDLYTCM